VVTGGSRGLGREMLLACARRGADVVTASRKPGNCATVEEEVRTLGRGALAVACHAARWQAADDLAGANYDQFDTVDVLVNNAGSDTTGTTLSVGGAPR
jgi:NAD(P)-dependent dehydrogenase (short-subunit alcohol dehydrogenase family)